MGGRVTDPRLPVPVDFKGDYKGMFVQGEDIAQSDPNTHHVEAALVSPQREAHVNRLDSDASIPNGMPCKSAEIAPIVIETREP